MKNTYSFKIYSLVFLCTFWGIIGSIVTIDRIQNSNIMNEFQDVYINILWVWILLVMVHLIIQKGSIEAVWIFLRILGIFCIITAIISVSLLMVIIFWSIVHSYNYMTNPEFYLNNLPIIIQIILFFGSLWIFTLIKNTDRNSIEMKPSNNSPLKTNTIKLPTFSIGNSPEEKELTLILSQIDISDISSIIFIPIKWQAFTIKTPNIKRLSVYITTKLGKFTFEPEELHIAFDHVIENISSDLSKTDFNFIQGKISEFVKSGGEVKIEKF